MTPARLEAIVDNLRNFAEVNCEREMAIICAVGENLRPTRRCSAGR